MEMIICKTYLDTLNDKKIMIIAVKTHHHQSKIWKSVNILF